MSLDLLEYLAAYDGELDDQWQDTQLPTDPPADSLAFVAHYQRRTDHVAQQLAAILHSDGWRMMRTALLLALRGEIGPYVAGKEELWRERAHDEQVELQKAFDLHTAILDREWR